MSVLTLLVIIPFLYRRRSASTVLILLIPFIAQFYQIILGWDVTLGAASFLRLLPFAIMALTLMLAIDRDRPEITYGEAAGFWIWELSCLLSYVAAWGVSRPVVALVAFALHALLVPLIYLFVKGRLTRDGEGARQMMAALLVGFVMLAWGSVIVSFVALGYRGSDSLLVARNANDGNNVLAYLLLAWPFVVLAALTWNRKSIPFLAATFLASVALLFSRGGLALVPPLMIVTGLIIARRFSTTVVALSVGLLVVGLAWVQFGAEFALVELWALRFDTDLGALGGIPAIVTVLLGQVSGRAEIWSEGIRLFMNEPIWGNGFGSFEALGPGFSEAHSLLFTTLAERGLIGFTVVYGLLGAWLLGLLFGLRSAQPAVRPYLLVVVATFACWFVFVHAVSSAVVVISEKGFMVNILGAMLLVMLFFTKDFARLSIRA
ncbi:MAG: O-antigen ligase family protein [Gemmatimonadota bacterium]